MKVKAYALAAAMLACSAGTHAKMLPDKVLPKDWNRLENADSISVECRNRQTGVIDRESVDVDARTVTVEIPGADPVVHRITGFQLSGDPVRDKIGYPAGWDMYLALPAWGRTSYGASVGLIFSEGRWYSRHEDGTTSNWAD
jgi:hypothetical protein